MTWWHWVVGFIEAFVAWRITNWWFYGRHEPKPEPKPVEVVQHALPPLPINSRRVEIAPGVYEDRTIYDNRQKYPYGPHAF